MEFTETQAEILANAYWLARDGRGQVLERWAYPDAVPLEEAGWLERRHVDATGDWSWHWTPQAEGGARHERPTPRRPRRPELMRAPPRKHGGGVVCRQGGPTTTDTYGRPSRSPYRLITSDDPCKSWRRARSGTSPR
jgi:hypothetical protein